MMKKIVFIFYFIIMAFFASAQIKGTGVCYFNGFPSLIPNEEEDCEMAIDVINTTVYKWNRTLNIWQPLILSTIDWTNITNIPPGIADGDQDTDSLYHTIDDVNFVLKERLDTIRTIPCVDEGNVLFVSQSSGNNTIAKKGFRCLPYANPWDAKDAALPGDQIHVLDGYFTSGKTGSGADREGAEGDFETTSLFKDSITYFLEQGTVVESTADTNRFQPIFYDTLGGRCEVYGLGEFRIPFGTMHDINTGDASPFGQGLRESCIAYIDNRQSDFIFFAKKTFTTSIGFFIISGNTFECEILEAPHHFRMFLLLSDVLASNVHIKKYLLNTDLSLFTNVSQGLLSVDGVANSLNGNVYNVRVDAFSGNGNTVLTVPMRSNSGTKNYKDVSVNVEIGAMNVKDPGLAQGVAKRNEPIITNNIFVLNGNPVDTIQDINMNVTINSYNGEGTGFVLRRSNLTNNTFVDNYNVKLNINGIVRTGDRFILADFDSTLPKDTTGTKFTLDGDLVLEEGALLQATNPGRLQNFEVELRGTYRLKETGVTPIDVSVLGGYNRRFILNNCTILHDSAMPSILGNGSTDKFIIKNSFARSATSNIVEGIQPLTVDLDLN